MSWSLETTSEFLIDDGAEKVCVNAAFRNVNDLFHVADRSESSLNEPIVQ